jgi:3-isopropylmalate/(R)-2-methylmalate dehydratase large subunit
MSIAGRMTLANMAVEMGAKNGIIAPDETTVEFLQGRVRPIPDLKGLQSEKDAEYESTVEFDVSKMEPQIACPSSVDKVKPVSEVGNVPIEQAFIGSCTNGRLEDLRLAAKVMKGKKVRDGVRALVIPASQEVWKQADEEGLLKIFTEAGAIVCGSACGPCLGGHIGLLAAGETCVSSSNRNFIGRMGSPQANVYLASPATVAASAIAGKIVSPMEVKA